MTASGGLSIAWLLPLAVVAIPACENRGGTALKPPRAAPILLFGGTGTSADDVAAVETSLNESHVGYSLVSTSQLNAHAQRRACRSL
jgi:hypothetical protein